MTLSRAQQAHLKSAQELAAIAGVELTVEIEESICGTRLSITGDTKSSDDPNKGVFVIYTVGARGGIKFAYSMSGYRADTRQWAKHLVTNQRWLRDEILKQRKAA
jgi:hypothetical protein